MITVAIRAMRDAALLIAIAVLSGMSLAIWAVIALGCLGLLGGGL